MNTDVSLHYSRDYTHDNLLKCLSEIFDDLGGITSIIKPKSKVLLKCNLSNHNPNDALTTHPELVSVVAELLAKNNISSIIVDNPNISSYDNISKIYEVTDMLGASNNGYAELNCNSKIFVKQIDGVKAKEIYLSDIINEVSAIINIPKLIVDHDKGLDCCLHNLFSLMPIEMQTIVKNKLFTANAFDNYLIDIYSAVKDKVVLNIVDAVVTHEPCYGQRIMNAIIGSTSLFHSDATALKLVGIDIEDSSMLRLAEKRGYYSLQEKTKMLGDKVDKYIKHDYTLPVLDAEGEKPFCSKRIQNKKYNGYQIRPNIEISKCKGCGKCISTCPVKAITTKVDENNEIYATINKDKCITCLKCVKCCPYEAIDVISPFKAQHLMNKIKKRLER